MNVLQKRLNIENEIKQIISKLKFKDFNIELKGSANLQSQRYPSDFDLFSQIHGNLDEFQNHIVKVLEYIINTPNLYLIELKYQYKDGSKRRWFYGDFFDITKVSLNDIDFIKIDFVIVINYIFKDVSVIYSFNPSEFTKKDIENEMNELMNEGKYFKALKRQFLLSKDNEKELLYLTNIFNSLYGKDYQIVNNIEAINKVYEKYKDRETKAKIMNNMKLLGISFVSRNIVKDKLTNKINKFAKDIIEEF
jgi:gamma-glutamylcyclotransferase (GGCT)/AIG2-like uncharacterized protein YtfP